MLGNCACFFVVCEFFLKNQLFQKKSFRNTTRMSNSLDPDQAGHFVGPDLGPNCLQRLSAETKSPLAWKELKAAPTNRALYTRAQLFKANNIVS